MKKSVSRDVLPSTQRNQKKKIKKKRFLSGSVKIVKHGPIITIKEKGSC